MVTNSKTLTLLAIESAVGNGSIAILRGTKVIAATDGSQVSPARAEGILDVIDRLLSESGVSLEQLEAIAVSTGPGSYSGIRIGAATALGLKSSLKVPCFGVAVLDAMAIGFDDAPTLVTAVPVGKKDAAWQVHQKASHTSSAEPPRLASESDFVASLAELGDPTVVLHSNLLRRLALTDRPGLHVVDAGVALAPMIGIGALLGHGRSELSPIYLRNESHADGSRGF